MGEIRVSFYQTLLHLNIYESVYISTRMSFNDGIKKGNNNNNK